MSDLLSGLETHNMDDKGRLAMPSKMRDILGGEVWVMKGWEKNLVVFPKQTWNDLTAGMDTLSILDKDTRAFYRLMFSRGTWCEIDKQGRVLIPAELRNHAGLIDAVVIAGARRYVELWHPDEWRQQEQLLDQDGAGISDRVNGKGGGTLSFAPLH